MSADTSVILPEPARLPKRIVFRHDTGLHRILGIWDKPAPATLGPEFGASVNGQPATFRLVAVEPRYYLYSLVK